MDNIELDIHKDDSEDIGILNTKKHFSALQDGEKDDINFDTVKTPDIKIESGSENFFKMFRFFETIDQILLFWGLVGSLLVGILDPLVVLILGNVFDAFNVTGSGGVDVNTLPLTEQYAMNRRIFDSVSSSVNTLVLRLLFISLGCAVGRLISRFCLFTVSERQGIKLRKLYMSSLIHQDAAFYDFHDFGSLTSSIATDVQLIQEGFSYKLGLLIEAFAIPITGFVIGFIECWDLTLVILSSLPFVVLSTSFIGFSAKKTTEKSQVYDTKASSIAESTLGNIRTVQAFGQYHNFCENYKENIFKGLNWCILRGNCIGLGMGFFMFVNLCTFALGLFYGTLVISGRGGSHNVTTGQIFTVFTVVIKATMSLSSISTPISAISIARVSAFKIFKMIDRKPDIDANNVNGFTPTQCDGTIKFEDVKFSYPSRKEVDVLKGFELEINKGEIVAIVGASGCGKSTLIQLIQRNYDVTKGSIKVDGQDVRELNLKWLREQIGIVKQEPILFELSIKENIILGAKEGDEINEEEIVEVCKRANCHDFISGMPDGYDTLVGERGSQLSGGQKQRIAIARALIRNPKVLLLDEATSALDAESESVVQNALENAAKGRTTIVVAHKLSTIKNADKICVLQDGQIVECGKHDELMTLKGVYYNLVRKQVINEI
ncbi:multidrug resistance protein, putative [Entamoeba invadens IP1]|uniref:Multidrug resistance protein, putative n=1 Tax=Entamoeba invadens IP1 TaxID=370355 RepID=A0A0A1TUC0_ENTIV|nr:multidrug resistance protein, putative [Entamoeba invadens IP1]ELP83550.1 multidrug resistance protein, putative [Entamoeba invadens IP1]|eukprot:XP_004182896.1 multidrug resistance protein, putative [Entamoeba invadens IP1]